MSMMMEFRIADVVEKFRTLIMYKQPVEEEAVKIVFGLEKIWENLVLKASVVKMPILKVVNKHLRRKQSKM